MTVGMQEDKLAQLEQRLQQDLDMLKLPAKSWVKPRTFGGQHVHDVVVVGGGMCGLAATAQLRLMGVDNILTLDRSRRGFEGPWATYARMRTLRSPKDLAGPCLGLASLTYRAWHEASFGAESFADLVKIDRLDWMAYLRWYRTAMGLDIRNEVSVERIRPVESGLLALDLAGSGRGELPVTVYARRVVLATGRDNVAGTSVPAFLAGIDGRYWAHSTEDIDWEALRGKRLGVIGAGASAMDNAGHALENGIGSVDILFRRQDIPRINKFTGIESPGTTVGFSGLPDDIKWRFIHNATSAQVPPPRESVLRVSGHENARFHPESPIESVSAGGSGLAVRAGKTTFEFDFLIVATGFVNDAAVQSEMSGFAANVLLWADMFQPPAEQDAAELARSPYLGPGFEFREKVPGDTPGLERIHCFTFAATLSHGKVSGDVPAVSEGAQRLSRWICTAFFREDAEAHFDDLLRFERPELLGDEWRPASAGLPQSTAADSADAMRISI